MESKSEVEIVSLGVDWITGVATGLETGTRLLRYGSELATYQKRLGHPRKGWGMAGFSGFQVGQVQFGSRNHEGIIRLSGELAHTHWRQLYAMEVSCSRLDLECTSRTGQLAHERIAREARAGRRYSRRAKKNATTTFVTCTDGGATLYCGKRVSLVFGRVYNKAIESGDDYYRNCVRHEVEYKGVVADRLFKKLAVLDRPLVEVAGCLQGFFSVRTRSLSFLPADLSTIVAPAFKADDCSRLRWLKNAVGSSVRHLVEVGRGDDVLEALGLTIDHLGQLKVGRRT